MISSRLSVKFGSQKRPSEGRQLWDESHISAPKESEHKQRVRKRASSDQRCQNQVVPAHRQTVRQIGRERKRAQSVPRKSRHQGSTR